MQQLTELTSNPKQKMQIVLETNETVDFSMYFYPTQQSWYFDFSYKDITSNGNKLVLSPNLLRSYKNILPFGFMLQSQDGVDPFSIEDFTNGRVNFFVLNSNEVQEVEREVYNQ